MPAILIADDDQSVRAMISTKLERMGMDTLLAADGSEAIHLLETNHVDLILLDLNMPRLDGFDVTQWVRSNTLLMHIPILMLTARDTLDDKVAGLNAGADDYIVKPFELQELVARIEMHLRRAKRDQEVNPLTLLPGGLSVERGMAARFQNHEPFAVCYIDLDNFKSYNDRYGFVAGNDIIRLMAEILVNVVRECGDHNWQVGHIGGDDFVMIGDVERIEQAVQEIITRFDAAVPAMYAPEDRERGFIYTRNRRGELESFALVSVSIAVICYDGMLGVNLDQISLISADLKKDLKALPGSNYTIAHPTWAGS